jgi:hypothetical protein
VYPSDTTTAEFALKKHFREEGRADLISCKCCNNANPWPRSFFEQLRVPRLVKKFSILMKTESSLPCPKQPDT